MTATTRAIPYPCSPAGCAQPSMMSSIVCGSSSGTWARAARIITAAMSSARISRSDPFTARPIGERAVATITASGIALSSIKHCLFHQHCLPRNSQAELLHLSQWCVRQFREERHVSRNLEVGDPLAGEGDDVGGGQLAFRRGDDERVRHVPQARVGHAEHGRLGYQRMGAEQLLDLARVDVEPAGLE